MSAVVDQKAYLQKYLNGPSGDKKKKKKKPIKGKGFKIIDDDIDLTKLRPLDGDELDILNEGEDAPQIAGIIDERPDELKKLDYQTSKWRVINQDDGFNSKLQIQEVRKDKKEVEKENEIIFGKMYSDSEDEKDNTNSPRTNETAKKKTKHSSDSDFSPPRKSNRDYDSDVSPPRRNDKNKDNLKSSKRSKDDRRYDSDVSPPRKYSKNKTNNLKEKYHSRNNYNSDVSRKYSENEKIHMRRKDRGNDSPKSRDCSELIKNYDSDVSPPRKRKHDKGKTRRNSNDSDVSLKRKDHSKSRRNYDSDQSPPRKSNKDDMAKSRRKNNDNDSDLSPPRKHGKDDKAKNRRKDSDNDSDLSPPSKRNKDKGQTSRNNSDRRHENKSKERARKPSRWGDYDESFKRKSRSPERNRSRNDDSDASPPRKRRSDKGKVTDSDESPPRQNKRDSNRKMEKTLDGKKAGLQDAGQLKDENAAFRRREDEAFRNMTDEMSGRNAHAVSRKGKRETSEDRQKQREKAERQKMLDEKYKQWSKGLKQIEAHQASVQDFIHEAAKPLARYKDDTDLESKLKDVERQGDPMLKYMREKKRDRGELGPEKPTYKGQFPPNRFNIRPGYRWDGVDRSSGYEKKFFENQSKRKAQEEEAYKWSTEDL